MGPTYHCLSLPKRQTYKKYNLKELIPPKGTNEKEEVQKRFLFIAQAVSGAVAKEDLEMSTLTQFRDSLNFLTIQLDWLAGKVGGNR